jgi:hypothetical protein
LWQFIGHRVNFVKFEVVSIEKRAGTHIAQLPAIFIVFVKQIENEIKLFVRKVSLKIKLLVKLENLEEKFSSHLLDGAAAHNLLQIVDCKSSALELDWRINSEEVAGYDSEAPEVRSITVASTSV